MSSVHVFCCFQGKTGFGMPRNTQTKVDFADHDKQWLIEEQKQYSDAIVRLQSGTNQFESQKVFLICSKTNLCFSPVCSMLLHLLCSLIFSHFSLINHYGMCASVWPVVRLQGKTGFGMPRNTQTKVEFAEHGARWAVADNSAHDSIVRLQSGTNQYESQKVVFVEENVLYVMWSSVPRCPNLILDFEKCGRIA